MPILPPNIKLGTRGSALARAQSQVVVEALKELHPGINIEVQIFKTSGDRIADRPLHELGGKGLFVRELEMALLSGGLDLVVHSFKDVPVTMPLVEQEELITAAVPQREDVRDALIANDVKTIAQLPQNAKIGTGSLRRKCQLLALRPDLRIENVRGNIDTRIRKQREGEFDAIVLAMAGLKRGNFLEPARMHPIPLDDFLPDAGQGALALQCRRSDKATRKLVEPLDHLASRQCVELERAVIKALNGDCFSPIGALAEVIGPQMNLRVAVGGRGGELPILTAHAIAPISSSQTALESVLKTLSDQNVEKHLHG
jgi:hydroxymethylbilane synthase